ncbi:MAG: carboxypeptidase-like regulatory domain-containing protein, partial [Gemmatimonadales bacterium]
MAQRMCGLAIAFLLLVASRGEAQVRQINGRITNSQTEQGLPDATIAVLGTQIVAQAGNDGRFVLNAPDGPVTLVVRAIGFKREQLSVPAGQESADVALEPDVFKLEEIVITGQATGVEQRNLANAVSTVSAAELTRAPTPTIESALQGKIPGATIQSNSGAPGGGVQVNLRGVSTIIGDLEPLYVVDGIVVSDVAIPNGANAVTQAQAGGNPRN